MTDPTPLPWADVLAIKARWAGTLVCPTHGIPDCSALLNGCTVPKYLHRAADDVGRLIAELERTQNSGNIFTGTIYDTTEDDDAEVSS